MRRSFCQKVGQHTASFIHKEVTPELSEVLRGLVNDVLEQVPPLLVGWEEAVLWLQPTVEFPGSALSILLISTLIQKQETELSLKDAHQSTFRPPETFDFLL